MHVQCLLPSTWLIPFFNTDFQSLTYRSKVHKLRRPGILVAIRDLLGYKTWLEALFSLVGLSLCDTGLRTQSLTVWCYTHG